MSGEILFVYGLLLATIFLFVTGFLRLDVVAILVILTLMLSGMLTPAEALAGFGDSVVILIACLFVVGEALVQTGVAHSIGEKLMTASGTSKTRLLISLMLVVAGLSAFMSSTGAVAIFIPVAINIGKKIDISPSQLLIPIAIASLLGGMLTLIGTPPNLVVSNQLIKDGFEPFGFFDFTPIALVVLIAGIAYLLLIGRRWLPEGGKTEQNSGNHVSLEDLIELFSISGKLHRLVVQAGSSLEGKILSQTELHANQSVLILGVERVQRRTSVLAPITKETTFQVGDILYIVTGPKSLENLVQSDILKQLEVTEEHKHIAAREFGLVEVLVSPRSNLIGRTLNELRFQKLHDATVLAIMRKGKLLEELSETPLQLGDSMLLIREWTMIGLFPGSQKDFVVLNVPIEMDDVAPNRPRAPLALGIMLGMMILMAFKLLPAVTAVLLAAITLVLTKCVSMKDAYRSINWESVVLIAGMLPVATALEKTGGAELIANGLAMSLGPIGPMALLAGLFLLTSFFSQFISNTATAVLVAPIAVDTAIGLGVSPYPVLMTVAIAASTAFATPVASPVNTLVMGPGGYGFNHFVKVGIPLQIIVLLLTLLLVPLIFPF